ncbi:MAG: MarR family winged helix-turn-helix transcriptional regulator [Deltaproteobacteria bacterium]
MIQKNDGPSLEVTRLLTELTSLVNRRSAGHALALMNEAGLTMAQVITLFILDLHGRQAVGLLGQKVRLSPAAASHMIEQLVRAGLVARVEDPDDRRSRLVSLAERGRSLIRRIERERRRELSEALDQLTGPTRLRLGVALRLAVAELRVPGEVARSKAPRRKADDER